MKRLIFIFLYVVFFLPVGFGQTTSYLMKYYPYNESPKVISKQFSDKFFLTFTIDKTILGGLIIKVEGLLFDDSLKNKLQNIQNFVKEH